MATKKTVVKDLSSWITEIEKYSRQIWLAGLGAFSKVSEDGNSLFDGLVKDGEKAEKQAKTGVTKQVEAVKTSVDSAKSKVEEVKDKAVGKWNELEEAFDKRLNSAISRLGVPSRNEVKVLHAKVELLTKQIEKLTGITVKSVKAPTKTPAKPVAKAPVKVAAKTPAKPAAKPAAKAPVKTTAKPAAPKAPAKAPAKAAAKPTAPVAAKPAAAPASS